MNMFDLAILGMAITAIVSLWIVAWRSFDSDRRRWNRFAAKRMREHERIYREMAELVDVCERAIRTWGKSAQLRMAQEEASELSSAVSRYLRGRDPDGEALAGEIADVVITLVQAVSILGVERILPRIAEKVARLRDRIEEAERANGPT